METNFKKRTINQYLIRMKIPSRKEIYVERRSLDEFDVDTKGTPGNVVMEWLDDMEELRYVLVPDDRPEDTKDWEDTLLDIMNNIWYLCAAVIRQPRAYLHIAEYSRLLKDLYASTPYSYRPDATLSAACMLLEKTGTQRTDIVRFCTKLKNDNRQYLAEKFRLQQIRDKAWQITTDVSLDDFIGVPTGCPLCRRPRPADWRTDRAARTGNPPAGRGRERKEGAEQPFGRPSEKGRHGGYGRAGRAGGQGAAAGRQEGSEGAFVLAGKHGSACTDAALHAAHRPPDGGAEDARAPDAAHLQRRLQPHQRQPAQRHQHRRADACRT